MTQHSTMLLLLKDLYNLTFDIISNFDFIILIV